MTVVLVRNDGCFFYCGCVPRFRLGGRNDGLLGHIERSEISRIRICHYGSFPLVKMTAGWLCAEIPAFAGMTSSRGMRVRGITRSIRIGIVNALLSNSIRRRHRQLTEPKV